LRVFAVEHIESYVFVAGDGYLDGDGSDWDCRGGPATVTIWAMTAGAPAAKPQTFALTVTAPLPDFAIAVTPTPNTTAVNQNVTWSGTLTA